MNGWSKRQVDAIKLDLTFISGGGPGRKSSESVWKNIHANRRVYEKYFTWIRYLKVVLGGSPRCPDNHDLSKCHRLYDLGRHQDFFVRVYQFSSLKFDSKKLFVTTPWDHLKLDTLPDLLAPILNCFSIEIFSELLMPSLIALLHKWHIDIRILTFGLPLQHVVCMFPCSIRRHLNHLNLYSHEDSTHRLNAE